MDEQELDRKTKDLIVQVDQKLQQESILLMKDLFKGALEVVVDKPERVVQLMDAVNDMMHAAAVAGAHVGISFIQQMDRERRIQH